VERNALRVPQVELGRELGRWEPGTWRDFVSTVRQRAPRGGLDPFNPVFVEGVSDAFLDRVYAERPPPAWNTHANLATGYDNEHANTVIYETLARMAERGHTIYANPEEDPQRLSGDAEGARVLHRMARVMGWNPANVQLAGASLELWLRDPVMQHLMNRPGQAPNGPVSPEAALDAFEHSPALPALLRRPGAVPAFGDLFQAVVERRVSGRIVPLEESDLSFAESAVERYGDEGAAAVLSGLLTRLPAAQYERFLVDHGIPSQHESAWAKARTRDLANAASKLSALGGDDLRYACADIQRDPEHRNLSTLALRVALAMEGPDALQRFWVTQGTDDRVGFARAALEQTARAADPAPYLAFLVDRVAHGDLLQADIVGASDRPQVRALLAGDSAADLRRAMSPPAQPMDEAGKRRGPRQPLRNALRARNAAAAEATLQQADLAGRLNALRDKGVTIDAELEQQILTQPARKTALLQKDFAGRATALEQIERVASAETLADGSPAAALASEMLRLAGTVREERGWGMSYARANQALFTAHHAGEFCRLVADLALDRETVLASGQRVHWSPSTFGIQAGRHLEFLWGGLNHLLASDSVASDATLSTQAPVARRGQMANMMTRLMGHPFVNVDATSSLTRLGPVVDDYGPVLAKYGDHAGSVAGVEAGPVALSLEPGSPERQRMDATPEYAIVPFEAVRRAGLEPIRYREGAAHYIHDAVKPLERPKPPVARKGKALSVEAMADSLVALGVQLSPGAAGQIAGDPARVAALNQRDASGKSTFEHIFNIAVAEQLRDGTDSLALAADLFESAGTNRQTRANIRCYARTLFGIYLKQKPAEMARLVDELAVDGRTTLPGGRTIRWDPNVLPINGGPVNAADTLFGGLAHTLKAMRLPDDAALVNNAEYAYQGEMANIHTRLTGRRYINVNGQQALPHVAEVVAQTGPLLAEYQAHGGSVAAVENGVPMSFENGRTDLVAQNGLGYVAFPEDAAQARGLAVVQPTDPNRGYAVN
jgi:hypothetical protein